MSVANGCKETWIEFSKRVGSYVCIDVAKDLGGLSPGAVGSLNMFLTARIKNTLYVDDGYQTDGATANNVTFQLVVIAEMDGQYMISPDNAQLSLGLTVMDADEADANGALDLGSAEEIRGAGLLGGKIRWSKLWRTIKHVLGVGANVSGEVARTAFGNNPIVKGADTLIQSVNTGVQKPYQPQGAGLLRV
jgi:hypothetical protein